MKTLTIHIASPEAEKMISDMAEQELIFIDQESAKVYHWYEDEAYINELNERLEAYQQNPERAKSWEEVKEEISEKLKHRKRE
jgi:hypothetical protein